MNFQDIRASLIDKNLQVFTTQEPQNLLGLSGQTAAVKLSRYKSKGYLVSPKKGVYFLKDAPPF